MADQFLDPIRDAIEASIDFEGQKLAEKITTYLLSLVGVLAFFVGFFTSNIYNTLYTGLGGTLLAFVIVVPPWPFFNQHPPKWITVEAPVYDTSNIVIDPNNVKYK